MRMSEVMGRGRRFGRVVCVLGALCGSAAALAEPEPLHVYVGQGQMPFANGSAAQAGLFGDLMRELCVRIERQCLFRSVPWRRVLSAAAEDPHGIVLNLGRTREREDSFVWLLDVLPTPYVLASQDRAFDSIADALAAGPVAVMAGTPRAAAVNAARRGRQQVVEVTDPEQAAHLLHSGRVATWYEIDLRILYLWRYLGYDSSPLFGQPINHTRSYIASGLNLEDAELVHQRMLAAFRDMRRDGSWQRILATYLGPDKAGAVLSDDT